METVEIIEIDEDTRLKVVTDDCPDDPRGWGWDVEFHAIDNYRIWRGWEHPEDPTAYAAWQYQQEVRAGRFTPEQRDRELKLYQSLTGDTRSFEIKEHRGYSQSDWATYLVIGEADALGLWETFDQWLKGDVYGIILEKREQFTNADETRELDIWEEDDSIWGNYLDDDYTARRVAVENGWIEEDSSEKA